MTQPPVERCPQCLNPDIIGPGGPATLNNEAVTLEPREYACRQCLHRWVVYLQIKCALCGSARVHTAHRAGTRRCVRCGHVWAVDLAAHAAD
jgi:ribosomal protein S27E